MSSTFKNTVISSFFWKFLEQCVVGSAQLVIGIILARILYPEDYAVFIIAMVFITLSKVFIDSGFQTALIQKKEITERDTSSVFYLSLAITTVLYILLFILSPVLAEFYETPLLTPVLQILGLTMFIGVFSGIQQVFVSRNFQFKKQFIVSISSALISGIAGIIIAWLGYGVWALVVQQVTMAVLTATILGILIKWRPKIIFSWENTKDLFTYGWKILVASLIEKIHDSIRDLSISTFYSKNELAYYSKGMEYPSFLGSALDGTVSTVLFPAYSKYQDDKVMLKEMVRRSITSSACVVFPAMFGLAAVSESFVELLLTEKWLLCVPFLQIFCMCYALQPISSACLGVIKATGKMNTYLKIQIAKTIFSFICLFCMIPLGVFAIAFGAFLLKIFAIFINSYPLKRLIGYSQLDIIKDLLPNLLLAIIMFCAVYCITFINLPVGATLAIQIIVGIMVYFGLAKLFRLKSLAYVQLSIKEFIQKKRQ